MEYTIKIKQNDKQKNVKVLNDYNDFLQIIQSTFSFSSEAMNNLKIYYQDPDECEESNDSYLNLENPDDYQTFLNDCSKSFIVLKFEQEFVKTKESKDQIENENKLKEKELNKNLELERLKELLIKVENELIIQKEKEIQMKKEKETELNNVRELLEKTEADLKIQKEKEEQLEKESELKKQIEEMALLVKNINDENKELKEETKEIKKAIDDLYSKLISELTAVIKKEIEVSQQNQNAISAQIEKKKFASIIHANIKCNHCNMNEIKGYRYKCRTCLDKNLCQNCFDEQKDCKHTYFIITNSIEYDNEQLEHEKKQQQVLELKKREQEQLELEKKQQLVLELKKREQEQLELEKKQEKLKKKDYTKEIEQFIELYCDDYSKNNIQNALEISNGDMDKAFEYLSEKHKK